ncbi:MAG: Maf family protein, partial [Janthinobacterium lividum]
ADYVSRVCIAKANAARDRFADARSGHLPAAPILSADTTVSIDGEILGKPVDADDARRMLGALSGNWHEVLTAVAVTPAAGIGDATTSPQFALSISRVRMAALDAARIQRYIDSGEPFGKAGAYAIQGRAAAFIAAVEGSYSGIMGLPLFETAELLQAAGMTVG